MHCYYLGNIIFEWTFLHFFFPTWNHSHFYISLQFHTDERKHRRFKKRNWRLKSVHRVKLEWERSEVDRKCVDEWHLSPPTFSHLSLRDKDLWAAFSGLLSASISLWVSQWGCQPIFWCRMNNEVCWQCDRAELCTQQRPKSINSPDCKQQKQ